MPLIITAEVDAIVQGFDASAGPVKPMDVGTKLSVERTAMKARSAPPEEDFGLWCELVPLCLSTSFHNDRENPWDSYFRPMSSMTYEDGTALYLPEVDKATLDAVEHWSGRARSLKHPVLKARYADVVWELGRFITKSPKRDIAMARIALDGYIDAVTRRLDGNTHAAFTSAQRAVDLAAQIKDSASIDRTRAALLGLHAEVMASKKGHMWSRAYDHLVDHKKARTTDAEIAALVADLETILARMSDSSNPETFNPHAAKDAADRLARHYATHGRLDEVRRLHGVMARTFEFHAGLGNATLAASFLQDSMEAYRQAGQPEEAERIRVAMQQKIRESRDEMTQHSIPFEITKEDMNARIARIVVDDPAQSLVNIAYAFLPNPARMEAEVANLAKEAPLISMFNQQIIADDRVSGRIGSVEDDPSGRILLHAVQTLQIESQMLHATLHAAIERHRLAPNDFVVWANRKGLVEPTKLPLLYAGVQAWFNRDFFKALHVIIPQIEAALRKMVDVIGKPTTKAAGTVPGVSVSINMSDILFNPTTITALGPMGPYLALYMKAVYADPRGMNLRNEFAHGLLDANEVNERTALWLIHSLLVIALWQKPEAP